MASESFTEIGKSYKSICEEKDVKINWYILKVLTKAALSTDSNETDGLELDFSGNGSLLNADRVDTLSSRLNDCDVEILCDILSKISNLKAINLRYNNLTDKSAIAVANLITHSSSLRHLDLMGNDFTRKGAEPIARAIQDNSVLLSLCLTGNKIENIGGMLIAQSLQLNNQLEHIDLGNCDLTIESIIAMATVLTQNQSLKSVILNRPVLFTHQEEGIVHLGKMLTVNNHLTELHLEKFDLTDFGVQRLCDGLKTNYSLKYLNISCNRLSRDGALILANLLKQNTALKVLDISRNRIQNEGIIEIASVLKKCNTNLQVLSVRYNQISSSGLTAIAECLTKNQSLSNLYIWGNETDHRSSRALGQLLKSQRLLKENTDFRTYTEDGVTKLAELSHALRRCYYWTPTYGLDECDNFQYSYQGDSV